MASDKKNIITDGALNQLITKIKGLIKTETGKYLPLSGGTISGNLSLPHNATSKGGELSVYKLIVDDIIEFNGGTIVNDQLNKGGIAFYYNDELTRLAIADPVGDEHAATKNYVDKFHRKYTTSIPTSDWAQDSSDSFYYATVSITGVLDTDIPELFCNTSSVTSDNISDYIKVYNMIIECESQADAIKFKAYDKPTVDLTVDILGLTPVQSST